MTEPLVLTVDQVAAILQVDTATVDKLARRGKLAKIRMCGNLRFRRVDVEEYIARSVKPCRESVAISPGSVESPADQIGSSTGTTPTPEKSPAAQRAQEMIEKLTRSSAASLPNERKPRPKVQSQSLNGVVLPFAPMTAA
ncbi:MAG: helix-turn-helix domain-containing protein [Rhodospirillaceae bacterium]